MDGESRQNEEVNNVMLLVTSISVCVSIRSGRSLGLLRTFYFC